MNQIACSSSGGLTAIASLNYLRPLYAALPLILAGATATATSRSITTGVRQFSTPVRTVNKLQSSAARQTPLTSGAIAIVRHFSSSHHPEEKFGLMRWFNYRGHTSILPFDKLVAEDNGFLVNGELKIVARVGLFEAIGKLDVTEENTTSTVTENVKGFLLLPSQAETMSRVFERHPELASELRATNPKLRTGYLSFLLNLIETMCQSPQELSKDDMTSAHAALKYMTDAGFKLDWLQKKLDELCEIKEKEKVCETQLQEMENELESLKMKCSDMEALVQKEKAKMSATKLPLSFDDLV
ncbi:unnamed protein product [Microthlaspi erraticum]|uniref:MATH domain-containing protein n=1 Tax=Microthlaspi erraticum TaxID=1685480 RepID=A0A6D2KZ42_9BRAS|nr:unnamed protein product [Microthlaspi erraticum]